tara:strand:+ start:378 stop:629 length:252 start_codon:yes stop_codon:yes gene_type:complete
MFRLIIIYEIVFLLFWNVLYMSGSGVENWFEERFLSAVYTVLSTMVLGFALVYVIYITLKISGVTDKLKSLGDPRKTKRYEKN